MLEDIPLLENGQTRQSRSTNKVSFTKDFMGSGLPWRPWVLRPHYLTLFAAILVVLIGIVQSFRQYVNDHQYGFGDISTSPYIHYTWTIPPILLATVIHLGFNVIVFKAERLMPWLGMTGGDSQPASTSLKLDYLGYVSIYVPFCAWRNKHWMIVVLSATSIIAFALTLALGPLMYLRAAVHDDWNGVLTAAEPGLVDGYTNLEAFYSAMADMSSAMRSGVNGYPALVSWVSSSGWSVGPFTVDPFILQSATDAMQREHLSAANMTATVSAIFHDAGCEATSVDIIGDDGLLNFTVAATGTETGCAYNRTIPLSVACCDANGDKCCDNWGGDVTPCNRTQPDGSSLDPSQQSFVFWTARMTSVDSDSPPNVSITICTPSIQLQTNVSVLVDVITKSVLEVSPSDEVQTPPLQVDLIFNGSAFNGFALDYFNAASPGSGVVGDLKSAISTDLLSAIVFQGQSWPSSAYGNNIYTLITQNVYLTYLTLVAREVYFTSPSSSFTPESNSGTVILHSPQLRLFVSDLSAHLSSLILGLMIFALLFTAVQLFRSRKQHVPTDEGTISASGIATKGIPYDELMGLVPTARFRLEGLFLDPPAPAIKVSCVDR